MFLRAARGAVRAATTTSVASSVGPRAMGVHMSQLTQRCFTSDAEVEPQHRSDIDTDLLRNMGPGEFGQVPKQAKPAPGTGGLHKLRPPQQRIPSKGNRKRKAHVQRIKKELGERANKPGVNFREAAAAVVYRTPVISRKLMPIEKKAQAFADRRPVREFSPLLKFGAEVGDLDRPEQQLNAVVSTLAPPPPVFPIPGHASLPLTRHMADISPLWPAPYSALDRKRNLLVRRRKERPRARLTQRERPKPISRLILGTRDVYWMIICFSLSKRIEQNMRGSFHRALGRMVNLCSRLQGGSSRKNAVRVSR
eukprot:TRINITY_DN1356_c0_g1_i1.p1 TRINITY_DN1356_c0_g1~~TRINITY_DN1356_c0_g1_i1.p1  ORF type:complete len:309 (+),score=-6.32 TRINITY_DN1356_c0_g1_i1:294-1220(+)